MSMIMLSFHFAFRIPFNAVVGCFSVFSDFMCRYADQVSVPTRQSFASLHLVLLLKNGRFGRAMPAAGLFL